MTRAFAALLVVPIAAVAALGAACEGSSTPSEVPSVDAAAPADAGSSEDVAAPPVDAAQEEDAALPALPDPLTQLSQAGLYDDIATKTISKKSILFEPASRLWSDGAEKRRWIMLPPGTQIDTSDMDHWRFPLGTRFFKEFAKDGKLMETRLIVHRADTGNPETDFWMGSFVWRDDESDADFAPDGKEDIRGTDHDAPARTKCLTCHDGDLGRILGFSALQLSKSGSGVTIQSLAAQNLLSHPPAAGVDTSFPGAGTPAGAALAYLHANCGHCHNPRGSAWPDTQMVLRLGVADRDPATSAPAKSTVGVALQRWSHAGYTMRIAPGNPGASGILFRMSARGDRDQMPPIATEHVDPDGIAAVTTWIGSL